ncbi:MAG: WbqC family protein [Acidobacteriota bacterium]
MRIVILQPGYLPWLGFFDQLYRCDRFVIYDDVQYTRRDWRSRNRIKTPAGAHWLTVPVINRGRYQQLINKAEIDYSQDWVHKHLGSLKANYIHAPFFQHYYAGLVASLAARPERLLDLNIALIKTCADWLGINTPLILASELQVEGSSSLRLLNICQRLGAGNYLTGDAARDYLDEKLFTSAGVNIEYHGYQHPYYRQLHGSFIPYLSIIDLLFNHGPESLAILTGEKRVESEE